MSKILQPPQIATIETIDGNFVSEHIPEVGECIFDTDKLLFDPRPNFKNLSIGDFDLYSACAYCLISKYWEDESKIEIEQNRIEKKLRIRIISNAESSRMHAYIALKKNGNAFVMERAISVLNGFFQLIDSDGMDRFQRSAAAKPFVHLMYKGLAYLRRRQFNYQTTDVFHEDVVLVFRKLTSEFVIDRENYGWGSDLAWLRSMFRGYRSYATFVHPELLE